MVSKLGYELSKEFLDSLFDFGKELKKMRDKKIKEKIESLVHHIHVCENAIMAEEEAIELTKINLGKLRKEQKRRSDGEAMKLKTLIKRKRNKQ